MGSGGSRADRVIGIDLGATRVKAGVVSGGEVIEMLVEDIGAPDRSETGIVKRLAVTARRLLDRHAEAVAIGIGAPGVIRAADGVITNSPNFPLWRDLPLGVNLGQTVGMPVFLDNDANAVTLGEAMFGAGRGVGDFVCLTLGSGLGGGIFLGGRMFRGPDGMAGELGHIVVEPEGFPCNCGGRGCLEQYASARGLRNMVARDRTFGDETDAAVENPDLPARLYDAAMAGDPVCKEYFEEFGYRLAIGLGGVLNLLNCHAVVLAGGLARAYPAFAPRLLSELPRRAFPAVAAAASVVQCELWENGGVLGAAAVAIEGMASRKALKRLL